MFFGVGIFNSEKSTNALSSITICLGWYFLTNSKKNKSPKQISSKIQKLNVYKAIGDCLSSKFSASKAVDGNLSTCWAMNLDNAVVECDQYGGPTFYLNCKQLCYVIIHNGFSKTKALYNKNTRVKSLYIFLNNNEEDCIDATLKDSSKPQRINIPQNETSKNITEIAKNTLHLAKKLT